MKNLTLLFTAIIMSLATIAQTPQGINYQTVIRDGDGNILPDTEISLQMTIRSGAPDGEVVYQETHDATTSAFGLVNLVIGYGVPQSNAFADIDWAGGEKFLETAIDLDGGGSYTVLGITQFLSVPFAFHAQSAETYTESDPEFNAWDKSTGIVITENQITDLQEYLTQEVDPDFNAWDKSTGIAITENQIMDLQDYLTEEVDPDFNAWDKSTGIVITENQIMDLQEYLTQEVDPEFNAWDKSTGIVITESQIADLQDYLTEEIDSDPTNELQTVDEQNYEVTLSQGGGTFMTGVKSYTQAEIEVMTPYNGLTVHNSTTNCINYYYLNNWFESCGTCTPQPTQAAAGDDQNFTDNTTSTALAANTPEYGTGLWTIETGAGGSFNDATNPTATFTGQPCTDYTLAWTITNTCGSTIDQVDVSFFATPTVADAGNDTIVGGGATSLNLYANTPELGEGMWTIISGEGGILADATNPSTLFTGNTGETYTLQWAISTDCGTSADTISVIFANIQIGEPYQGGIIAYILQPGDPGYIEGETHGIIAATSDQSTGAQWGCYGTSIPGADGTALGTGYQNTLDIVAGCSTAGIAAQICNDLELNGYNDWYLPSKDELNKLYQSKDLIGGFASAYYWSSSEYSSDGAWTQLFGYGLQYYYSKDSTAYVRAVRAF